MTRPGEGRPRYPPTSPSSSSPRPAPRRPPRCPGRPTSPRAAAPSTPPRRPPQGCAVAARLATIARTRRRREGPARVVVVGHGLDDRRRAARQARSRRVPGSPAPTRRSSSSQAPLASTRSATDGPDDVAHGGDERDLRADFPAPDLDLDAREPGEVGRVRVEATDQRVDGDDVAERCRPRTGGCLGRGRQSSCRRARVTGQSGEYSPHPHGPSSRWKSRSTDPQIAVRPGVGHATRVPTRAGPP